MRFFTSIFHGKSKYCVFEVLENWTPPGKKSSENTLKIDPAQFVHIFRPQKVKILRFLVDFLRVRQIRVRQIEKNAKKMGKTPFLGPWERGKTRFYAVTRKVPFLTFQHSYAVHVSTCVVERGERTHLTCVCGTHASSMSKSADGDL